MSGSTKVLRKKKEIDFTSGPLLIPILMFTLPILATGILQFLYNTADTLIVSNYAADSESALAAVTSTGSLSNLITGLFIGLSVGASVTLSHSLGAGQKDEAGDVVHTAISIAAILGVVVGILGFITCKPLLVLMDSPTEVLDHAALYMRIVFIGMPAQMVYNYGAALLRAKGDTKRPLYFLMIAGAVNVACNLVFVIVFHLDVAGVALATIISQYLSATLVIIRLSRLDDECKLDLRHMRISRRLFVKIIKVGIPAGIQGCLFSFSNVIIQSSVNSFDKIGVAGNGAAATIDGLIYIALNSFYHASLTFSGQNLGARQIKRVKKTCYYCLALVLIIGVPLCLVTYVFGEPLLNIFLPDSGADNKAEIIAFGMERMLYTTLTYFLCGLMEVMSGMLRGLGASTTSMVVSLIGACAMRVVWVYAIFNNVRTPGSLYISYPISWLATTAVLYICYAVILKRISDRIKNPTPPLHHKGA